MAAVAIDMFTATLYADAVSTTAKAADWLAYDGTYQAVRDQAVVTFVDLALTKTAQLAMDKMLAPSRVVGPLFRNELTGRFVSDRIGWAAQALPDVVAIYGSYEVQRSLMKK
jgi:hypothetical protein